MLNRVKNLKRKLSTYADEESRLYDQVDARFRHLQELMDVDTVDDVKYESWSRQRLDRLLVDYLLRHGYIASATALADEQQMRDLVDIEAFTSMNQIRQSLENGSVTEALAWCNDNKKELRKMYVRIIASNTLSLPCSLQLDFLLTSACPHLPPPSLPRFSPSWNLCFDISNI